MIFNVQKKYGKQSPAILLWQRISLPFTCFLHYLYFDFDSALQSVIKSNMTAIIPINIVKLGETNKPPIDRPIDKIHTPDYHRII